jgi:nucleoside-diphosphate-sugar epimerase
VEVPSSEPRVLITGGAGFIGSSLVRELMSDGFEPIVYDCKDSETSRRVIDDGNAVRGDVRDFGRLRRIVQSIDGIIHLAAVSRVVWGYEHPLKCVDTNIQGTANVLEAARQSSKKPWVIYGSSREVYGEPEDLPVPESAQKKVVNVYGMTKIAGENLCRQYHRNYGLSVGILRFSNVYGGVHDHLDRVIPKFIIQSLKNEEITIHGGMQVFDFTHISDTLEGILKLMSILDSNNESYFEDFHILTGKPTSLQQLVKIIQEATQNRSDIIYGPARTYDVERFYGDPAKATNLLGYTAKTSIEEGIARYVPLLDEYLEEVL